MTISPSKTKLKGPHDNSCLVYRFYGWGLTRFFILLCYYDTEGKVLTRIEVFQPYGNKPLSGVLPYKNWNMPSEGGKLYSKTSSHQKLISSYETEKEKPNEFAISPGFSYSRYSFIPATLKTSTTSFY